MAFTWNYGNEDEIIVTNAISELSSAITSLENHIRINVTNPSASRDSNVTSSLWSNIRTAVDTLDDYNYCRTYDSGQLIGVLSGRDTSYDGSDRVGRLTGNCSSQCDGNNVTVQNGYDSSYDSSDDGSDPTGCNSDNRADNGGLSHQGDNSDNAGCQSR